MAFEAPSFSLGFEFSVEPDPVVNLKEQPPHLRSQPSTSFCSEIDDEIEFVTLAKDAAVSDVLDAPPPLKRLRRGFASERDSIPKKGSFELGSNLDDDIEEFSSQEDSPSVAKRPLSQHKSVCSSSKSHLPGQGIFRRVAPELTQKKMKQSLDTTPASSITENTGSKSQFPKLTISPLRKFQLISDSDSDSDYDDKRKRKEDLSSKSVYKQGTSMPFGITSQKDDLWKDFESEKSFAIPTPALDEVCEEYFRSVKDNTGGTNKLKAANPTIENKGLYGNPHSVVNAESNDGLLDQPPPSRRYFLNDDPRICNLVRTRLPHFFPLDNENTQPGSSVIDYKSQFGQGESSKANNQSNSKNKKNSKATAEDTSWVNPRNTNKTAPENAAKRRVQAVGHQSTGHWFTDSSGRRVYVNKNGQELTGKIAYVQYKKDSGTGFKKSKKKKSGGKKKQGGASGRK